MKRGKSNLGWGETLFEKTILYNQNFEVLNLLLVFNFMHDCVSHEMEGTNCYSIWY